MKRTSSSGSTRGRVNSGTTLIELLTVLAVIGLIMAVTFPAILSIREMSQRMTCASHLHQIGIATEAYVGTFGVYPGDFGAHEPPLRALLPYIGKRDVLSLLNESPDSRDVGRIAAYRCPSDGITTADSVWHISYGMNDGNGLQSYGHNGLFHGKILPDWREFGQVLRSSDITDGLSNTAAFSEWLVEEPHRDPGSKTEPRAMRTSWYVENEWHGANELSQFANECLHHRIPNPGFLVHLQMFHAHLNGGADGYHHVLPPNSPSCWNGNPATTSDALFLYRLTSASSLHRGGANVLNADGAVRFVSDSIDRQVWSALGSRNGNETRNSAE